MTPTAKRRLEEIRHVYELNETPQANDVNFLLTQFDELSKKHDLLIHKYTEVKAQLDEAHVVIQSFMDLKGACCGDSNCDVPWKDARKLGYGKPKEKK